MERRCDGEVKRTVDFAVRQKMIVLNVPGLHELLTSTSAPPPEKHSLHFRPAFHELIVNFLLAPKSNFPNTRVAPLRRQI